MEGVQIGFFFNSFKSCWNVRNVSVCSIAQTKEIEAHPETATYLHASRSGSFLDAHIFVGVLGWDGDFGLFVGVGIVVVVVRCFLAGDLVPGTHALQLLPRLLCSRTTVLYVLSFFLL